MKNKINWNGYFQRGKKKVLNLKWFTIIQIGTLILSVSFGGYFFLLWVFVQVILTGFWSYKNWDHLINTRDYLLYTITGKNIHEYDKRRKQEKKKKNY